MDVKKLILAIGMLVIAAVTALMARNMFYGASAPAARATPVLLQQPTGPEVLVASRALPVGTIIQTDALRYQRWPESLTQPAYFIKGQTPGTAQDLVGSVVRNEIAAGQPLTVGSLIKPGDRGFLAAALGPGMRAITVPVSNASSVAGFVFPGDRVDIVLTQEVAGPAGSVGPPLKASETILRNVRVLATDQRTTSLNPEGKPEVKTFGSVTLETTPKIAEKIAVAQTIGQLSLSLRSIADNNAELQRAVAAGDAKAPAGPGGKDGKDNGERQMLINVASQPIDSTPSVTVGREVSRFQRATVPAKPLGPDDMPQGPTIRIARGNRAVVVPVGDKRLNANPFGGQ
jgi:pilus assembly protein CpaB